MKNKFIFFFALISIIFSCSTTQTTSTKDYFGSYDVSPDANVSIKSNADWYKDAIFYHIWVKAFKDSNGDGVGDINGITSQLDILQDLGINALWLSPIFECAGKPTGPNDNMHGYDTVDYYKINDKFGTEEDVKNLLTEAHKRNIRVIFDFVVNHTSDKHPWFENAKNHGDKYDWYVWSKNPEKSETKKAKWILPWNVTSTPNEWKKVWHKFGDEFYYGPFWRGMPDLNLENQAVRTAMANVMTYWLNFGFDGVRIDAVRYAIEEGPGKQADTVKTHTFFKELRKILDKYTSTGYAKMSVAEAWTVSDKILPYYGNGTDEFHSCFDFPLAFSINDAVKNADRDKKGLRISKLLDALNFNNTKLPKESTIGLFLMNHDIVTSRPMTEYKGNIGKVKIATALGILLPGTPYIYNGNELSMEDAKLSGDMRFRTPLQWDKLPGLQNDKKSIWNWHKTCIALRNQYECLRRGKYSSLESNDKQCFTFARYTDNQTMIIVINMDKESKSEVSIDLSNNCIPEGNVTYLVGNVSGDKQISDTNKKSFAIKDLEPYEVRVIICEANE